MGTTTTGLYEVVLEQTYFQENFKNVFHYLATLGQDDDQDLIADAFNTDVLPGISTFQSTDIVYDEIRVANLTGLLADFSLVPTVPNGVIIGDPMANFVAIPFRYVRTSKETRNGAKRFGGLTEGDAFGGGFTPTFFAAMQLQAPTLAGQISTTGIIAEPVILRKPDVAGVWTYNDVSTVIALNRITSQNSRKPF